MTVLIARQFRFIYLFIYLVLDFITRFDSEEVAEREREVVEIAVNTREIEIRPAALQAGRVLIAIEDNYTW